MSNRLRDLDNKVLGRSVHGDRPLAERMLRPRPAVSSGKGRLIYGGILLAMIAVARWVSDPLFSGLAFVVLLALAGVVTVADERERSRRFLGGGDR